MAKNTKDKPGNPDNEPKYEVGYGKPPRHTRFEKGQSGNPRGWPKAARDLKTFLAQELDRKQRVTVDGKVRWLTNRQIAFVAQIAKARKGDPRAFRALTEIDDALHLDIEAQVKRQDLSANERAILQSHLDYIRRKRQGDTNDE